MRKILILALGLALAGGSMVVAFDAEARVRIMPVG